MSPDTDKTELVSREAALAPGERLLPGPIDRRARIVDAMVLVVYEHGFAGATVGRICAQAGVGRSTFYEVFDGPRDCFLAVIDEGHRRTRELIEQAFDRHTHWLEGVRAAIASLLSFLDAEPSLAHVWLIETLGAGSWALRRRELHVATMTSVIVERWPLPEEVEASTLAATAVMEAVLGIIRAHVLQEGEEPLISLLGPLMGIVTTPYLPREAVAAEIGRSCRLADELRARPPAAPTTTDRGVAAPKFLRDARASRARQCLLHVALHPGISNRGVARALGIRSDTQISALLARLRDTGLLEMSREHAGGPNAWRTTAYGETVEMALRNGTLND